MSNAIDSVIFMSAFGKLRVRSTFDQNENIEIVIVSCGNSFKIKIINQKKLNRNINIFKVSVK